MCHEIEVDMSIEINLLRASVTALYMFFPEHIFSAVGKEFCVVRPNAELDGMGGWFARAEGSTQAGAEARVIAEAEWLLVKRR